MKKPLKELQQLIISLFFKEMFTKSKKEEHYTALYSNLKTGKT